jgi:glycogen(starch) synthase
MSKKVAVIASILKPVDDTRLYEKLGLSMRESNKYQINIIGFEVKKPPVHSGVTFHSLYNGQRFGIGRVWAPWKFLLKLISLKPELVIVCTPELLLPGCLYKTFTRKKLWYDVQENYQRNIIHQSAYSPFFKPLLRLAVWLAETLSRPFVDHYLLAEQGYASELTFVNGKHTILENKFRALAISPRPSIEESVRFVFTGTISIENGIMEAISLVQAFCANHYPVQLYIVGQVPDHDLLDQIEEIIKTRNDSSIKLVGGHRLVSHKTILEYADSAQFGLIAHQPNPSTENCIPTKIYEYLGLGLPMLLQKHSLWESVVAPYNAAMVMDYNYFRAESIWKELKEHQFYTKEPGPEITWKQEANKLLELL